MTPEEKVKILSGFRLFANLDEKHLEDLAEVASEKDFKSKEMILEEGSLGEDVYFIYKGSVRIYKITPEGKEVNLTVQGAGDIVGEMALFDHGVRSANVETLEECKTLKLSKSGFENVLKNSPDMAIELLRIMSRRIAENAINLENLMTHSLKDRVLTAIKTLHSYMPHIKISQEELASLVGATRPRVSEVLSTLQKEKIINIENHEIVLRGTE